ncbi:WD40 repeat-like protein, partial [Martensiomyces pterosporus]
EEVRSLANQYPDQYWKQLLQASAPGEGDGAVSGCIDYIDEEHPLELLPHSISDQMALTGMALSLDGAMLATFGSSGQVHIWDTDTFECLTTLRDSSEPNIDEFFVGQFTPNSEYLVVGGKLKDRKRWSEADEDNHILPCPLKIFNVLTGEVVARLEGHSEEILCIKGVVFKGENYLVTTSQDGYIRRWHMDSDWVVLLDTKEITDGVTCMAFTVSFLPNTGNRYFMAATDDHVTLMDLEQGVIVQRFDPIYSSTRAPAADTSDTIAAPTGPHAYFVTRGVELLDAEDNTVSSRPNTCTLHRLVYPTEPNGKFALQEIRRYYHDEYLSNSWLIRIAANGRYLLAPTLNGQVFVFNIATGQVTGILRDHD